MLKKHRWQSPAVIDCQLLPTCFKFDLKNIHGELDKAHLFTYVFNQNLSCFLDNTVDNIKTLTKVFFVVFFLSGDMWLYFKQEQHIRTAYKILYQCETSEINNRLFLKKNETLTNDNF